MCTTEFLISFVEVRYGLDAQVYADRSVEISGAELREE